MIFIRKLSRRSKMFAAAALACGALAFQLVRSYAAELEVLRPIAGQPVPVVVAADAIERGSVLGPDDLRIERIPSTYAPPGAIAALDAVVDQTVLSDIAAGEPITRTRLSIEGGPVASLVPSGLRAFPIRAVVPPGTVQEGDRVDVLATYGGPHPYTETVAEKLEVMSAGEDGSDAIAASGDGTVSLLVLVSPETAEQLAFATAYGDLAVSVAPPADTEA